MPEHNSTEPIISAYRDDEDMVELIELFVDELPDRIAAFAEAFETKQWEQVRTLSHQLKGAAPGYGFDTVGRAAGTVERFVMEDAPAEVINSAAAELIELCRRVSKG